eukprot:TRINITY_DN6789_c0_g1_i1.p1 TRINITY_DN6789_c0_g1~~TRINITY_DN6789_c0_g1_i1.p1  ORF type:complete len:354 (+),score=63.25 TRINITY_DN6789_c0_g1_i1:79-1062(+)
MQSGNLAMWAGWIGYHNSVARPSSRITTVYTYGGDMEYYAQDRNPYQTYFPPESQLAAQIYKNTTGVEYVIAVIDGRMDGGEDWSPDVSKLTAAQCRLWADRLARLYCSFDFIDGLQVDLEPFSGVYRTNLLVLLSRLANQLQLADNNCVNARFPNGRSLSSFMFASDATPEVFSALGRNSYIAVSGYDLASTGPGVAQTPLQYATALQAVLNTLIANAGTTGKYTIGVPAAASTHEFSSYIAVSGAATPGYPNFSTTADSYLVRAVLTVEQASASSDDRIGPPPFAKIPKSAKLDVGLRHQDRGGMATDTKEKLLQRTRRIADPCL